MWARSTHHSIASSSPVPLIADVLKIWYLCVVMDVRPRALATSLGVIAPSMSCLLANITNTAFFSSSSWKKSIWLKWIIQIYLYRFLITGKTVIKAIKEFDRFDRCKFWPLPVRYGSVKRSSHCRPHQSKNHVLDFCIIRPLNQWFVSTFWNLPLTLRTIPVWKFPFSPYPYYLLHRWLHLYLSNNTASKVWNSKTNIKKDNS